MEGILEKGTVENGKDVDMLAGETFGQEALIEEAHVNEIYVWCVQPTKMLEIKKTHFERYVRPLQLAEWDRVATIVSELPVFNEPDAVHICCCIYNRATLSRSEESSVWK